MKINTNTPWLGIEELALMWNVTNATVRSLIFSGQLKAYKIGRQYKVTPDDLQIFLANADVIKKDNQNEEK